MANYLNRIRNLMVKMKSNNYEFFDGDQKEAFDTVEMAAMSFPKYTNTVIREQVVGNMLDLRDLEPQQVAQIRMDLDRQRHDAHEAAIGNMNLFNRLAEFHNQDKIFDVNTDDRYAVADAVGQFVNEVYNNGIGKTMDSAAYNKHADYDPVKAKQAIHERPLPDISGITDPSDPQPSI